MPKSRALIGMSGGVDSSAAAFLTINKGYDCIGGTMRLHDHACGGSNDAADAKAVADRLGIPHYVFDFRKEFEEMVIRSFAKSYEKGLTPNPCIQCNRFLKFDQLMKAAFSLDCDKIVSGHYAQVRQDPDTGRWLLCKAADTAKDQSYFLASLSQDQLAHILFPLGSLTKLQVRQIAEEQGFVTAKKRDSQDICFVPEGDYGAFLEQYGGKAYPEGDFLDLQGRVVGKHRGAVRYTLGQRRGLGVAMGTPVYVCSKDMARNTVTIGPNEALFSPALRANDWNWYPISTLTEQLRVTAKVRHSQFEQDATVFPEENGFARVEFDSPQRAVTPGQAVVLYQGDLVLGGGTITEAL